MTLCCCIGAGGGISLLILFLYFWVFWAVYNEPVLNRRMLLCKNYYVIPQTSFIYIFLFIKKECEYIGVKSASNIYVLPRDIQIFRTYRGTYFLKSSSDLNLVVKWMYVGLKLDAHLFWQTGAVRGRALSGTQSTKPRVHTSVAILRQSTQLASSTCHKENINKVRRCFGSSAHHERPKLYRTIRLSK